jgi:Uma2 family endonuclease
VRPITVEQFEYLVDIGFFGDAKVEMLDGFVVNKMTHGSLASTIICLIADLLRDAIPKSFAIRCQVPIKLAHSEPEPDIAVVVGPVHRYRENHPVPAEVFLVIEVSDSTLAKDRGPKLRAYARNGIREYWLVNCVDRQIEVYTEPAHSDSPSSYTARTVLHIGESVFLQVEGQSPIEIPLALLFGE